MLFLRRLLQWLLLFCVCSFCIIVLAIKVFKVGDFSDSNEQHIHNFTVGGFSAPIFSSYLTHPGHIQLVSSSIQSGRDTRDHFPARKPVLVFIHGSPGDWSAYSDYFKHPNLVQKYHLVSVDRAGFGGSKSAEPVTSFAEQARRIHVALVQHGVDHAIFIGHSLGGPIATQMAVDYPEMVSSLLLLAPSLAPELESLRWYNRIANTQFFRWLLPKDWNTSNAEMLVLEHELSQLQVTLNLVTQPTIVIQGMKDRLVLPGNAEYAKNRFAGDVATWYVEEGNHFILWKHTELVIQAIESL